MSAERPKTFTERALEWFEREPCTRASCRGGLYSIHHGPTGYTVTRLSYEDAVMDLYNLVGRERT